MKRRVTRTHLGRSGDEPLCASKRLLEGLGFEVKGEVCGCDIVAVDRGSLIALVICELKLSFTLDLVLQAVDRSTACDEVWLAVRASLRSRGRESDQG